MESIAALLQRIRDINSDAQTACKDGDWVTFRFLVKSGASIYQRDSLGTNLLLSALEGYYHFYYF